MKHLGLLALLSLMLPLTGCGQDETVEKHIKNYRLTIVEGDKKFAPLLQELIADFNAGVGFDALQYDPNPETANSAILITPGLEQQSDRHNVGYGQWITETQENKSYTLTGGRVTSRIIHYSMRLEFDYNFLAERSSASQYSEEFYELKKLFHHEVGHGIQLAHKNDPKDIMHESISGPKNFEPFYRVVKDFYRR